MPKVSVIIPNYNHEQFLRQRLESVFSQSLQDFEVIFLDDCSTDGSLEVLDTYRTDSRVSVVLNTANSGSPFKQWNRGLDLAIGEFIWIAESDDYADSSFLEKLTGALDKSPEAGLAYCQSWIVGSHPDSSAQGVLQVPYAGFSNRERWSQDHRNSGTAEITDYLVFNNTIANASSVVFRRSVLQNGLRAPENMRLAGDWMFWIKILLRSDLIFLAEPLNFFREPHTGSQRHKTRSDALELLEGIDVYTFVTRNLPLDKITMRKVLMEQTKVWGTLSWRRRLGWKIGHDVYSRIAASHPEIRWLKALRILSAFAVYYLSTPLRHSRSRTNGHS